MTPARPYGHHQPLHRQVLEACQGWTVAVCSGNAQVKVITTLLLEQALVSRSIAELLAQLTNPADPLLVISDDDLPDGGADQLMELLRANPAVGLVRFLIVLPLAVHSERLQRLWQQGADALLSLESGGSGLGLRMILALVAGGSSLDPAFDRRLRQGARGRSGDCLQPQLSRADQDLLLALARGRSTREIAALRQVRCDSVRRQLSHLYRKANVGNQRDLLAWGLEQGVLRPADWAAGRDR
jgi:DNA-binding NarL/FixJ family response regulator